MSSVMNFFLYKFLFLLTCSLFSTKVWDVLVHHLVLSLVQS